MRANYAWLDDAANQNELVSGPPEDVAAILAVLDAESAAFWAKDLEAYARCWVDADYVRRTGWWSLGGVTWRVGWSEIEDRTRQQFRSFPDANPTPLTLRRENLCLRVRGDMAWVSYEQHAGDHGEAAIDMPGLSRETKILERHDGSWKLVYIAYLHHTTHQIGRPVIETDASRSLLRVNAAAETALAGGCGLVIRNGRLRAMRNEDDQRLGAALAWAGRIDVGLEARRGQLPILLRDPARDTEHLCWIVAESDKVLVSIEDRGLTGERLERAAVIYGLSSAQALLASRIVAGEDLSTAAEGLGVSINTVRTQLRRIFDKTGVRNQVALVRLLLTAAGPGG